MLSPADRLQEGPHGASRNCVIGGDPSGSVCGDRVRSPCRSCTVDDMRPAIVSGGIIRRRSTMDVAQTLRVELTGGRQFNTQRSERPK